MRIGIDGFAFQKSPGGIGIYIISLIRVLMQNFPNAEIIIYSNKDIYLPDDILEKISIKQDFSLFRFLNPTVWLKFIAGLLISKDNLNFYFSSAGLLPYLSKSIRSLVVIHDINYKIVPETMGRLQFISHLLFLKRDVSRADFVVCNSQGTSEKVLTYFGRNSNTVINPPTDNRYRIISIDKTNFVLNKYEIRNPYFLTVGTIEPRKNLEMTINAFISFIEKKEIKDYKLVVVGSTGWRNKNIIKKLDMYKENIIRLGYVPDDDLPALYNGSSAFLFPSIYEGFGMPAREAVYCGKCVITSNTVELREATHNKAIYIDPLSVEEYEKALLKISENNVNVKIDRETNNYEDFLCFFK